MSCAVSDENTDDKIKLGKSYGEYKVDVKKAVSVADMVKTFEAQSDEMEFTIEADLNEVCSKAGPGKKRRPEQEYTLSETASLPSV